MSLVISAPDLRARLRGGQKDLLIVDTRPFSSYAESHIPGAVNVDLMQFHWIDTSRSGIEQFNRQTRTLLSNIGVSKEKFVVFYDDISGPSAARGVWLLLYFSHDKVAMLDGGLNRWKAEGYQTETRTNPLAHSSFAGRPNPAVLSDFGRIRSSLSAVASAGGRGGKGKVENGRKKEKGKRKEKKNAAAARLTIILDSRSKEEYEGSVVRAARPGHIPSAVNIDWNENVEQDAFKTREKLEEMYSAIPKDAEVITYCQGGYRAANSFVALRTLGYKNVRMYLGSWGEWGNRPGLPVSTGKSSSSFS